MNHTPGPWEGTWQSVINVARAIESDMRGEAWKEKDSKIFEAAVEANARLIAAAPEMLEALIYVVVQLGYWKQGVEAIEKATGRTWAEIREERK